MSSFDAWSHPRDRAVTRLLPGASVTAVAVALTMFLAYNSNGGTFSAPAIKR